MKVLLVVLVLCVLGALAQDQPQQDTAVQGDGEDSGTGWSWFQSDGDSTRRQRKTGRAGAGAASVQATQSDDGDRPKVIPCATARQACLNFDGDVAKMINQQINEELKASYIYQSMAFYYGRDDISMRGFSKFFQKMSDEERDHAQMFMNYLNKRGGQLIFMDIPKPTKEVWGPGLEAMKEALKTEHFVNGKLLDLHWVAQQKNDPHLQDFLEGEFLTEQVDSAKQLSDYISVLERMKATPLGEFIFDQELWEDKR